MGIAMVANASNPDESLKVQIGTSGEERSEKLLSMPYPAQASRLPTGETQGVPERSRLLAVFSVTIE